MTRPSSSMIILKIGATHMISHTSSYCLSPESNALYSITSCFEAAIIMANLMVEMKSPTTRPHVI